MNKVPDRVKMRREYLRQKCKVVFGEIVGFSMLLVCGFLAFLFALISSLYFINLYLWRLEMQGEYVCSILAGLLVFGMLAVVGYQIGISAVEKDDVLQYVPPVNERLAYLPAGEVLLRGSEPSTTAAEELLRPAGSEETRAEEELLRPSLGNG